jgi:glycosyltransferase involved in cell wall biosynthesis
MRICLTGPCSPRDVSNLLFSQDAEVASLIKGERGIPVSCLAEALVKLNHSVTVITSTDQIVNRIKLSGPNFDLVIVPQRKRPRDLALTFYRTEVGLISKEIQLLEVDIINAHWTYEHAIAAMQTNVKCVVTAHDSPYQVLKTANHPFWIFRFLMAVFVKIKCSQMIFVSEDLQQKWKKEMNWSKKSWVIPNMQPFQVAEDSKIRTPSDVLAVLSVGDNSFRKNIKGAVVAFNLIKKEFPEAELNLVGPGLEIGSSFYKEMSRNHSIEGVIWHGYLERPQLLALMQSCDVLMQPSLVESFGLTLVEAMSLGLSVIAGSNTGAAREVVGDAGLLVNTKNAQEMANALRQLLGDQRQREDLALRAIQHVEDRFSSEVVAKSTVDCYLAIIGS